MDLSEGIPILYRISDATGTVTFEKVDPPLQASLSSDDAFLLDNSTGSPSPAIYVWIGNNASLNERHLSLQYAQRYLYDKKIRLETKRVRVSIPIVKMQEGYETPEFLLTI